MSPKKWIESTNAIGIRVKAGRYGGGTFAHKDIAFNFGMWISPVFQLYVVKSYQTLVSSAAAATQSHQSTIRKQPNIRV